MDLQAVDEIIHQHGNSMGGILSVLSAIQSQYGYLPEDALRRIAESTRHPLSEIYAVATFYRAFSLAPRGEHLISVCLGTACHVRGAQKIVEEFSRQLRIRPGETTGDKKFSLETVNCLGACALGPTVVVDGRYFRHVNTANVEHIIEQARQGMQRSDPGCDERIFPVSVECPKCGQSLMDSANPVDGIPSVKLTVAYEEKKGSLHLSSFYGSHSLRCACDIPAGAVTSLSCPHCKKEIDSDSDCPKCGVKMAIMPAGRRALLYVCPRRGCPGHRLDLTGLPQQTQRKGKRLKCKS